MDPNGVKNRMFGQTDDMVDVSHGFGIPFGGIGTGYCVFGKYGFVNINFNSTPDMEQTKQYPNGELWKYTQAPKAIPPFAFVLTENSRKLSLQQSTLPWIAGAEYATGVKAYAYLPKGYFIVEKPVWNAQIEIEAFSPMIPHDLASSTIPAQVYNITLFNRAGAARSFRLGIVSQRETAPCENISVINEPEGSVVLACAGGTADSTGVGMDFTLGAGEQKTIRFVIAWHYPQFRSPSPAMPATYRRYYAANFNNAREIAQIAMQSALQWSAAIDEWHEAYDVPPCFKRLWFSSLSSVITSTLMSDDPYFFEIETPHWCMNTMDVTVYSGWIYMINWPELERMDMDQYLAAIPSKGPEAGLVWHSLWNEAADYMEEPIFPARIYRDFLWFNDRQWLENAFEICVLSAARAISKGSQDFLLSSCHGNQSYDAWKMPGVGSYVNTAWIYSLYALKKMSELLSRPAVVAGMPVGELLAKASASFDSMLWNEQERRWDCFFRTPSAEPLSVPEASFLDQLFGLWLLLLDGGALSLQPADKVKAALATLYCQNLIADPDNGFRGWSNGMLPGGIPDMDSGHHSRTCWICSQLDLGSLLGATGSESQALDVFESVEASLHNNHLAVGEWNQSADENRKNHTLPEEPGKDTPRFPAYPRYKCSWEYLVRLLGMTVDSNYVYLNPFKTIKFGFQDIRLAGMGLSIQVERNWDMAFINGQRATLPLRLNRNGGPYRIVFNSTRQKPTG